MPLPPLRHREPPHSGGVATQELRTGPPAHRVGKMTPAGITIGGRQLEGGWWHPGGASPPLVLLHEGLGSRGLWRDFPAALSAVTGRAVFAFSRFGYGGSDPAPLPWPLDYMQREALDVLPAVLDAAGIGYCVLVGHSDGASIAAIAAGSKGRERYRGLILLAPHFFVEAVTLTGIRAAARGYAEGGLRDKLARHHRDPDNAFHGWSDAWLDPGFPAAFDLAEPLTHIRVPMLILQGTHDPYGTAAQARRAACLCPAPVRTVLLECGHAPHIEAGQASRDAVAGFIDHLFRMHENAD